MSSEDLSPASLPFQSRIRDMANKPTQQEVAHIVHEYVDLAKRILLEHRVRDFTAAEVVALAAIMEARDRQLRYTTIVGSDK
jgi:hypothetical protein